MEKLVIKNSRWKYVLFLVICIAFVVANAGLLMEGEWLGWIGLVFFGSGIPLFIWQIMDSRPRLIIDERGVFDRTLGVGCIAWSDVQTAYVKSISGTDFICLELRNAEQYRKKSSAIRRAMTTANRNLGFSDFSLNLSGVNAMTEDVFELVMKYCASRR